MWSLSVQFGNGVGIEALTFVLDLDVELFDRQLADHADRFFEISQRLPCLMAFTRASSNARWTPKMSRWPHWCDASWREHLVEYLLACSCIAWNDLFSPPSPAIYAHGVRACAVRNGFHSPRNSRGKGHNSFPLELLGSRSAAS